MACSSSASQGQRTPEVFGKLTRQVPSVQPTADGRLFLFTLACAGSAVFLLPFLAAQLPWYEHVGQALRFCLSDLVKMKAVPARTRTRLGLDLGEQTLNAKGAGLHGCWYLSRAAFVLSRATRSVASITLCASAALKDACAQLANSVGGTSKPSAFAVLRLMASSCLVGACTGRVGRLQRRIALAHVRHQPRVEANLP
jgi:hypothetical protein